MIVYSVIVVLNYKTNNVRKHDVRNHHTFKKFYKSLTTLHFL